MNRFIVVAFLVLFYVSSVSAEDPPSFVLKWGAMGSGIGQFDHPYDVAVDQYGNVYVADTFNDRVQVFASDSTFLFAWATAQPTGIDIDPQGHIVVTDTRNDCIKRFTASGFLVGQWGSRGVEQGQFMTPWCIAVDKNCRIYVGDNDNDRIQKFDTVGTFLGEWGERGVGPGEFNGTRGIAVDSKGCIYVADKNNNRIQKFTSGGTFILEWGPGQLANPSGVAVDAYGNVYTTEYDGGNRVQKFTSSGSFLSTWGELGADEGDFDSPHDIAIGADGAIYVADRNNYRIQKFEYVEEYEPGSLYFYTVSRFYTKPKLLASSTSSGGGMPVVVKICADGSKRSTRIAYAVDMQSGSISDIALRIKEDPPGAYPEFYGSFTLITATSDSVVYWYEHPRVLDTDGLYDPIHLQIVNTAEGDSLIREYPMNIYRAPVVMMHGLWSDRDAFKEMDAELTDLSRWPGILTLRYNYPSDRSFQANRTMALHAVRTAIIRARNANYSAGRVNLITHSMGGDVSRLFIQNRHIFCDDICRFITLSTPHAGSQLANLVFDYPNSLGKILQLIGKDPFNGAVNDLRVDSDAVLNDLNGDALNNNIVPSHVIATYTTATEWTGWIGCIFDFLTLCNWTANIDSIIADIFNDELNDLVVPISSQLGGCARSTTVADQGHDSIENAAIIDLVICLLNEDPYDTGIFSRSGFHPPALTYDHGLRLGEAAGSVAITGPSTGTTEIAGNVVPIMVEGAGDVARLQLTAANRGVDVYSEVQNTPSATFNYQIPIDAAGAIIVVAAGYGDAGFVDMDSIAINVLIEANLDSITLFPDAIYVMETEMATFSVTGHFDDCIDRELSFHPDMTCEIADTMIAKFIEPGIVQGVSEGTTSAIATFQGDTASALVVVLPYHTQTGIDDGLFDDGGREDGPGLFDLGRNFPNPFNALTIIQYRLHHSSSVELVIYNVLGQKVRTLVRQEQPAGTHRVMWDGKNDGGRAVSSGIYLYRITDGSGIFRTSKMVLLR